MFNAQALLQSDNTLKMYELYVFKLYDRETAVQTIMDTHDFVHIFPDTAWRFTTPVEGLVHSRGGKVESKLSI